MPIDKMALKMVLEPIFEADFYPTSYGFRPHRSTHDALARSQCRLHPTKAGASRTRYVIEGDIKGCFDAIDHHVLMERVRRRIKNRKVLRLVLGFLKADIMIEGNRKHPVTGSPQGGVISPLLANIYLTAIDERYKRWIPNPQEGSAAKANARAKHDRKCGRPVFYMVRYADDFIVFVQGTRKDAEDERQALAQFLEEELRMKLSMEKTKITDVREGFDFPGYRVAQKRTPKTGRHSGKLFIPKSKLKLLRRKIKVKVRETSTGRSLTDLINSLNPLIIGWRNYYRYAARAWREFGKLDWWLGRRIMLWIRRKHDKASWADITRLYGCSRSGKRKRWRKGNKQIALFSETKHKRFPDRGVRIPNGWNAERNEWFQKGADKFWEATRTLAKM